MSRRDPYLELETPWQAISSTIHRSFGKGEDRTHESISIGAAGIPGKRCAYFELRQNGATIFCAHVDPKAARHLARTIFATFPEETAT